MEATACLYSLLGVVTIIPIIIKVYAFIHSPCSRILTLKRAIFELVLSDYFDDYNFKLWSNDKAIFCNYFKGRGHNYNYYYRFIVRDGEHNLNPVIAGRIPNWSNPNEVIMDWKDCDYLYPDKTTSGGRIDFATKTWTPYEGFELNHRGHDYDYMRCIHHINGIKSECRYYKSDNSIHYVIPSKIKGELSMNCGNGTLEDYIDACYILYCFDDDYESCIIDLNSTHERRGAWVMHCLNFKRCFEIKKSGGKVYQQFFQLGGSACTIEGMNYYEFKEASKEIGKDLLEGKCIKSRFNSKGKIDVYSTVHNYLSCKIQDVETINSVIECIYKGLNIKQVLKSSFGNWQIKRMTADLFQLMSDFTDIKVKNSSKIPMSKIMMGCILSSTENAQEFVNEAIRNKGDNEVKPVVLPPVLGNKELVSLLDLDKYKSNLEKISEVHKSALKNKSTSKEDREKAMSGLKDIKVAISHIRDHDNNRKLGVMLKNRESLPEKMLNSAWTNKSKTVFEAAEKSLKRTEKVIIDKRMMEKDQKQRDSYINFFYSRKRDIENPKKWIEVKGDKNASIQKYNDARKKASFMILKNQYEILDIEKNDLVEGIKNQIEEKINVDLSVELKPENGKKSKHVLPVRFKKKLNSLLLNVDIMAEPDSKVKIKGLNSRIKIIRKPIEHKRMRSKNKLKEIVTQFRKGKVFTSGIEIRLKLKLMMKSIKSSYLNHDELNLYKSMSKQVDKISLKRKRDDFDSTLNFRGNQQVRRLD